MLFEIERRGDILEIGFGDEAGENDAIVKEVESTLKTTDLTGGGTLKINGRASLPIAIVIGHAVAHMFREIGCFDPKLDKYVIVISHGGREIGTLID